MKILIWSKNKNGDLCFIGMSLSNVVIGLVVTEWDREWKE